VRADSPKNAVFRCLTPPHHHEIAMQGQIERSEATMPPPETARSAAADRPGSQVVDQGMLLDLPKSGSRI